MGTFILLKKIGCPQNVGHLVWERIKIHLEFLEMCESWTLKSLICKRPWYNITFNLYEFCCLCMGEIKVTKCYKMAINWTNFRSLQARFLENFIWSQTFISLLHSNIYSKFLNQSFSCSNGSYEVIEIVIWVFFCFKLYGENN